MPYGQSEINNGRAYTLLQGEVGKMHKQITEKLSQWFIKSREVDREQLISRLGRCFRRIKDCLISSGYCGIRQSCCWVPLPRVVGNRRGYLCLSRVISIKNSILNRGKTLEEYQKYIPEGHERVINYKVLYPLFALMTWGTTEFLSRNHDKIKVTPSECEDSNNLGSGKCIFGSITDLITWMGLWYFFVVLTPFILGNTIEELGYRVLRRKEEAKLDLPALENYLESLNSSLLDPLDVELFVEAVLKRGLFDEPGKVVVEMDIIQQKQCYQLIREHFKKEGGLEEWLAENENSQIPPLEFLFYPPKSREDILRELGKLQKTSGKGFTIFEDITILNEILSSLSKILEDDDEGRQQVISFLSSVIAKDSLSTAEEASINELLNDFNHLTILNKLQVSIIVKGKGVDSQRKEVFSLDKKKIESYPYFESILLAKNISKKKSIAIDSDNEEKKSEGSANDGTNDSDSNSTAICLSTITEEELPLHQSLFEFINSGKLKIEKEQAFPLLQLAVRYTVEDFFTYIQQSLVDNYSLFQKNPVQFFKDLFDNTNYRDDLFEKNKIFLEQTFRKLIDNNDHKKCRKLLEWVFPNTSVGGRNEKIEDIEQKGEEKVLLQEEELKQEEEESTQPISKRKIIKNIFREFDYPFACPPPNSMKKVFFDFPLGVIQTNLLTKQYFLRQYIAQNPKEWEKFDR